MLKDDDINWIANFQPFKGLPQSKNFFDIGFRGHFENPMSDILSFFLDPKQDEHGFGDRLLARLMEKLDAKDLDTSTAIVPTREWWLDDGKRIDIVLSGDDWVLVIENKVLSVAKNDFPAYQRAIEQDSYLGSKRTKKFCLLTPFASANAPDGWSHVDSLSLLEDVRPSSDKEILDTALFDPTSPHFKWMVLFDEFRENLKQISGRGRKSIMAENDIEEYSKQLQKFNEIARSYELYYQDIRECVGAVLKAEYSNKYAGLETVSSLATGWAPQARAFSFRPFKGEEHQLVFLVCADKMPREKIDNLFQVRYWLRSAAELSSDERTKLTKNGFAWLPTGRDKLYNCFYANTNTFRSAKNLFLTAMQAICDYRQI